MFVFAVRLMLIIMLLGCVPGALGQETASRQEAESEASAVDHERIVGNDELTVQSVESALAAIQDNEQLPATVKEDYATAIDSLKRADEFSKRTEEYSGFLDSAPPLVEKARSDLEQARSEDAPESKTELDDIVSLDVKELRRRVDAARANASELADALSELNAEAIRVKGRPVEISKRQLDIQREMAEADEGLRKADAAPDSESPEYAAKRSKHRAAQRRLTAEQTMLEKEQLGQLVREELLTAELALASLKVERGNAELLRLQTALNDRLSDEAREVSASIPDDLPNLPKVQALADEVKRLAEDYRHVVASLKELPQKSQGVAAAKDAIETQFGNVKSQITLTRGGPQLSRILFRLADLAEVDMGEFEIGGVTVDGQPRPALTRNEAQLQSFRLMDKIRASSRIKQELGELSLSDEDRQSVDQLLENRSVLLEKLPSEYSTLSQAMLQFETSRLQLEEKAAEVREYVKQQLFGFRVRSCAPFSLETFSTLPEGLGWCFQPAHWLELQESLVGVWTTMPIRTTLAIGLVALLLAGSRRNHRQLNETGVKIKRFSKDRFGYTVQALLLTAMLALPLPLLFGYVAWALDQTSGQGDWIR
ncbi:MAG: hypothetical protein AAFU85_20400, partial [Planctomycetota bacterium]